MGLISRINAAHLANMDRLDAKAAELRARVDEQAPQRQAERDARREARQAAQAAKQAEKEAARARLAELAEAERVGLVAEYNGVRLYADRIERGGEAARLTSVSARVEEHRTGQEWGGWDQKDVWLTIAGPGFEWPIRTNAIWSSRKAREFAAKVNAAATSSSRAPAAAGLAAQLAQLAELHQAGALTDDEYAAAKGRVLGTTAP